MSALTDADRRLLDTLRAEHEIKQALARYCRGVDRKDYDLVRTAFHTDAWDDHGAFSGTVDEFIQWQTSRHTQIEQCMHVLGNCIIELEGDQAFVETYCTAVLHNSTADGTSGRTSIGCRYVDRFENRSVGWRIAQRQVVYEWLRQESVAQILPAATTFLQAQRSSEDFVYRIRTHQSPRPDRSRGA